MNILGIAIISTTALATYYSFLTTHYIKLIKERNKNNEKN